MGVFNRFFGRKPDADTEGLSGVAHSRQGSAFRHALAALDASRSDDRIVACQKLGEIGDPAAVKPLAILMRNDNLSSVQEAAIAALGQIGGEDATHELVEAVASNPKFALDACRALDSIGWQPTNASLCAWMSIARKDWKTALSCGDSTFDALGVLLQVDRFDEVVEAAEAMGKTPRVLDLIKDAFDATIKDRFADVRCMRLLRAISKLKDERFVDPVLALLENLRAEYQEAQDAANKYRPDTITPELRLRSLDMARMGFDSVWRRRMKAVVALGELGDRRVIEPLQRLRQEVSPRTHFQRSFDHMVEAVGAQGADGMGEAATMFLASDMFPPVKEIGAEDNDKLVDAISVALAQLER